MDIIFTENLIFGSETHGTQSKSAPGTITLIYRFICMAVSKVYRLRKEMLR